MKRCTRGHKKWHQNEWGCSYIIDVVQEQYGPRAVMCCDITTESKT